MIKTKQTSKKKQLGGVPKLSVHLEPLSLQHCSASAKYPGFRRLKFV